MSKVTSEPEIIKALIVKEYWGRLILDNKKTWEIRGSGTRIRGRVGIIFSGTGKIFGSVNICNSAALTCEDFNSYREKHYIYEKFNDLPYKKPFIWEMEKGIWFPSPITYKHPQGAVIWINLNQDI